MVSISLLIVACVMGLVIVIGLSVGIIVVLRASQRDPVSAAREDWLGHSNDDDETGRE